MVRLPAQKSIYLFCPPIYSIVFMLIHPSTASSLHPSVRSAVLKPVHPYASPSVHLSLFRVSVCLSVFLLDISFPSVAWDLPLADQFFFSAVTKQLLRFPYRRRKTLSLCKPIVSFETNIGALLLITSRYVQVTQVLILSNTQERQGLG